MMMRTYKRQEISISNKDAKNSNSESEDDKERPTILDLPNEVVLKIFSYLESSCLLQRVSLVCKSWKALAEDSSLWKTLKLNCFCRTHDFLKVLRKYKFVKELSIYDYKTGSRFLRAFSHLSGLRSLKFIDCIIPQFQVKDNFEKLRLISLNLSGVEFAERLFDIADLNFLKCLKFKFCDADKENLIASLKKCTQLENICLHFDFNSNGLNNETINSIIQNLPDTLVGLCISGNKEKSSLNLSKCSNLSKFIHYGELCDFTLFQIMQIRNLEELRLELREFNTSESIIRVLTEGNMSNLICLALIYCKTLNNFDIIAVSNNCKKLSTLILQYNDKITDVGMSAILNKCSNIVELRLLGFTKLRGTFLLEIIEGNLLKNLKIIDLDHSSIERKYVAVFEAARPDVQILKDFEFCEDFITCQSSSG